MKVFNLLLCSQKGINSIPVRPRQKKTFSPSHFSSNCWQLKWCWQNSFAFKPSHSRTERLVPKRLHQLFFCKWQKSGFHDSLICLFKALCSWLNAQDMACRLSRCSPLRRVYAGVYTLPLSSLRVNRIGVLLRLLLSILKMSKEVSEQAECVRIKLNFQWRHFFRWNYYSPKKKYYSVILNIYLHIKF